MARLFGELRPLWRQAQLVVFGHAALEKLCFTLQGITAHVWRVDQRRLGGPSRSTPGWRQT
jgi:hypothetical protein